MSGKNSKIILNFYRKFPEEDPVNFFNFYQVPVCLAAISPLFYPLIIIRNPCPVAIMGS
jgi:hypothetical protein